MRQETGATVIALDPSAGARRAASWLFPALEVMFGSAAATGLETSSVDVVLLTGVLSLIHDVHRVLREAERIVRPDGAVAIADLFASGTESFRSGPNWFRSVEATCSLLRSHGWMIAEVGVGTTRPADTWRHTGERVDNWITSHRSGHPGFESWMDDQLHLRRHIDDGDVIAGCIVARRGGAPNSDESRSCG
jgi:SAM-dependent methyltransferase